MSLKASNLDTSYRVLPTDEWEKLQEMFTIAGHPSSIPHPNTSIVVVAEKGDRIIGFSVMQLVAHCEPIWIDPLYRTEAFWPRMVDLLEETLGPGDYYAFAPDEDIERMCKANGMHKKDWKVYEKRLARRDGRRSKRSINKSSSGIGGVQ